MKKTAILLVLFVSCISGNRFDSRKWKEQSSDPAFPNKYRKEMVADLISSHRLIGLDSLKVFELLGSADYVGFGGCSYRYEVIGDGKGTLHQNLLNVSFSNGRVDSVFVPRLIRRNSGQQGLLR